ncbi:unnamed protein product [Brassica rapa subsp. narinosa]
MGLEMLLLDAKKKQPERLCQRYLKRFKPIPMQHFMVLDNTNSDLPGYI